MPQAMPDGDLPRTDMNAIAMRRPSPVSREPHAMENAATMSSTTQFANPLDASSPLAFTAPVVMAAARAASASDGVGRGCRTRPEIVATKMPNRCARHGGCAHGPGVKDGAQRKDGASFRMDH